MTNQHKRYDVASLGNYTKDTIVTTAGTVFADGGGFNYAAHAAASLGCDVAAITRLASVTSKWPISEPIIALNLAPN